MEDTPTIIDKNGVICYPGDLVRNYNMGEDDQVGVLTYENHYKWPQFYFRGNNGSSTGVPAEVARLKRFGIEKL